MTGKVRLFGPRVKHPRVFRPKMPQNPAAQGANGVLSRPKSEKWARGQAANGIT